MKIRKAVIPAAGLGTRVLPASKACPKELLPIVDKPAIQYIVEEAVASGITDILIILSRGKSMVADHFDRNLELEEKLESIGKNNIAEEMKAISKLANIQYIRQTEMKGLGHAISCAKPFVGDEPFAVLYGDDVIFSDTIPACKELCDAYEKYGKGVVGAKAVPQEHIGRYGSLKAEPLEENFYSVSDMIEKPAPGKEFSLYSIMGRCVLPSKIFDLLENLPAGAGGEIQLTDAMKKLAQTEGMIGVEYHGKRYDMGNKLGILQANIEIGLKHPEIGPEFRQYLKNLAQFL
ncbi:MAG: UTP--glucose-1-phosphate uridylyltransferase GalU [Oscillospiraceae bacterium]|nr:UTP--glucose-1-phosphate uridylyltransferase GalU [Oscillospiraceae bacterium]